ncbi:MAG: 30S ribosomal protein S20 [Chthonomonas sp.]|nr:30S ribosomal protein S20 [Chthonomonas sp.]
MANIKSMKKDLRRNAKKRAVNLAMKSSLKTYIKKAKGEGSADTVTKAVKALDKAVQRGIIHKNQAARRKSRMMLAANKAAAAK